MFNVIISNVPSPPNYGLILDRWSEYDKHCAMKAYINYLYLSVPLICIGIRHLRFKNKGESLIDKEKKDEVENKEPMQEFVDDFKLKTKEDKPETELKEV